MLERDAVIRHRVGQVVYLRQHRSEAGLVGLHLAGEADARQRAAVEATRERDHGRALGMKARDLDGVLHRLRAGGQEYGLLGTGARGERAQLLGEGDVALVRGHLKAGMYELFQLPRDRLLHLLVHVACDPLGACSSACRAFGPAALSMQSSKPALRDRRRVVSSSVMPLSITRRMPERFRAFSAWASR